MAHSAKKYPRWSESDLAKLLKKYRAGDKVSALAKQYQRSTDRIRQLIYRELRKESAKDKWGGLSTRVKNCLKAGGINTLYQLLEVKDAGRLLHIPNFGRASFAEVIVWLENMPALPCPICGERPTAPTFKTDGNKGFAVCCEKCGATGAMWWADEKTAKERALSDWNKRSARRLGLVV